MKCFLKMEPCVGCNANEHVCFEMLLCHCICIHAYSRMGECNVCICLVHVCMNAGLCVQSLLQGSEVGWREGAFSVPSEV